MFVRNPRKTPTPRPAPLPTTYNSYGVPLGRTCLNMAAGKAPKR